MAKDHRGGKRAEGKIARLTAEKGEQGFASEYESTYAANQKESRFFGRYYDVSRKYFHYEHYKDDDNIIINTNNIKYIKREPVLIVNDNQAVYVKDWNVAPIHNHDENWDGYAVRLQRKYFKPYTFRSTFDDYSFSKPDTFDSLVKVAKEQDKRNMKVATRHRR